MAKIFLLSVLLLLFTAGTPFAAEWVLRDYPVNTDEISRGVNSLNAEQGLIPVGLGAVNDRIHVHYVSNSLIGATAWKIDVYRSVDSFFAGLDRHVAEGYTPVDLTTSGENVLVLFLKMRIRTKGWKWITTKIDGKEVSEGIKKFVSQGYIPAGMTIVSGAFGILLIQPVNCRLLEWQIGAYSRDVNAVEAGVRKELESGFIPFGYLAGNANTNIMLVKVEMTDQPAAPPGGAQPAQASGSGRKPASDSMSPEKLLVDICGFIELMRENPGAAGNLFMTAEAEIGYADMVRVCGPALRYFAHGAIPLISYQSDAEALVGLYHPWTDTLMITRWRAESTGPRIYDVELVTGDFMRQGGEPPYNLQPLWLRSEEKFPPEAVRKMTAETSAAFSETFDRAAPGLWRHELRALRNPGLLAADMCIAAGRMKASLQSFKALLRGSDHKALSSELEKTMSRLHASQYQQVLKEAAATSASSAGVIAKSSASFWQRAQLMAVRADKKSGFIFLSAPGVPWLFTCLYFESLSGKMTLSRIELLNFPVKDAFSEVNK
ncbi:MAG: hypothetical protein RDV48_24305 [Candidatus Eremiobacteraeota bacterium]|nr:hypothetical protein [Candidatus Eremiobacteraeota bacterium]